jgi:hypothetical protein
MKPGAFIAPRPGPLPKELGVVVGVTANQHRGSAEGAMPVLNTGAPMLFAAIGTPPTFDVKP